MAGRLAGKVAIVSGGARGQGAAEARLFAREGASVVFGDILDEEGMKVEAEIRELGGEATYTHLDVTVSEDWSRVVALAQTKYGRLNVLVNNAGITLGTKGIEETTEEQWDLMMDVNVKGVFMGTKHALPAMRQAGGGSIINISSTAGLVGIGRTAAYTASKGAMRLFTKATAIQHAKDGVRCNSVHPGPVNTPFLEETLNDPEALARRIARVPLGRLAEADDIAYGVLFLASDESSFMTGSELVIDGGTTAE